MSVRLRLTLWYTLILAVTLLIFGTASYVFLSLNLYKNQESELNLQSRKVLNNKNLQIQQWIIGDENKYILNHPPLDFFQSPGVYMQLIDMDGKVDDKTSTLLDFTLPYASAFDRAKNSETPFTEKTELGGAKLLVYNVPLYTKGKDTFVGLMQVAINVSSIESSLRYVKLILLLVGLVTILLAASLGLFMARKALKPIDRVIEAANQIQSGNDLNKKIEYAGPNDEIGRLTSTINGMLGRIQTVYSELEEAYSAQRRFVSDASHELRTPLTTIRGNVELLGKMWRAERQKIAAAGQADNDQLQMSLEAMEDIAGEAERMSRLVNDLLALARADAGYAMRKEPVEIHSLVLEVIRKSQMLPHTTEWQTGDLSALESQIVIGDKDYLQQMLFIFIENAFKYTPAGYVRLDAARNGDLIGIRISDTGIGMHKDEVPHIFDRFYRADPSRGKTAGTGLGLSIAKWIIDEHGGFVEVITRLEEGTSFMIWLPVSFPAIAE